MPAATVVEIDKLPAILTARNIQEITGLSRPKVYELLSQKNFPAIRFGKAIRVPKASFIRWIEEQAGLKEER